MHRIVEILIQNTKVRLSFKPSIPWGISSSHCYHCIDIFICPFALFSVYCLDYLLESLIINIQLWTLLQLIVENDLFAALNLCQETTLGVFSS
jgi:hypothetical protein